MSLLAQHGLMMRSRRWTPAALSPLEWWDFGDASTVTVVDDVIASISSKGTAGRTASQVTAAQRPALTSINSVKAALFDGVNDALQLASALATSAQMTVVQVFSRPAAGSVSVIIGGSTLNSEPYATNWWTDNVRYSALCGPTGGFATHGAASTETGARQHIIIKSGSTRLYEDGEAIGAPQSNGSGSGDLWFIGRRAANYHAGKIGEVIVFSSALSDGDREKIEGYVAHRWGLSLPVGHPYEIAPP